MNLNYLKPKLKDQISKHSFLKGFCFKILNIAEQV